MSICRHFTSDFGPDLEPIMNGPMRAPFELAYKMGPLLGRGGFGTVYAGERTKDQLPVAIKVIKKAKITQWCKVKSNLIFCQKLDCWKLKIGLKLENLRKCWQCICTFANFSPKKVARKPAAILQPLLCFLAKILQLPGWLVCTHIHKQDDASSGLPVKLELNRMNITRAAFSFYFDMLQWI